MTGPYQEFEEEYIAEAKRLTRDLPDRDAWKTLWDATRKRFSAEELAYQRRAVFLQLKTDLYSGEFARDSLKLEDVLQNLLGHSFTGLYPEFPSLEAFLQWCEPILLEKFELFDRITIGLEMLGRRHRELVEVWNPVVEAFSKKLSSERSRCDNAALLSAVRRTLTGILVRQPNGKWLCGLVRKRADGDDEIKTLCKLFKFSRKPPGERFDREHKSRGYRRGVLRDSWYEGKEGGCPGCR